MAGWPSLGIFTHILIVVAQVPPEEHDGPSGWLYGAWESKALLSLHWSQAREEGGQAQQEEPQPTIAPPHSGTHMQSGHVAPTAERGLRDGSSSSIT